MTQERDAAGEEAGTVEVTALAAVLAHVPAPRLAADTDEDEDAGVLGDRALDRGLEPVVLPCQHDEFTCPRCYLVVHVSRRVGAVCRDCS